MVDATFVLIKNSGKEISNPPYTRSNAWGQPESSASNLEVYMYLLADGLIEIT